MPMFTGMSFRPTTLERAYQLAESGDCRTVSEVRQRLAAEGFERIADQLYGSSVTSALRERCQKNYKPTVIDAPVD